MLRDHTLGPSILVPTCGRTVAEFRVSLLLFRHIRLGQIPGLPELWEAFTF